MTFLGLSSLHLVHVSPLRPHPSTIYVCESLTRLFHALTSGLSIQAVVRKRMNKETEERKQRWQKESNVAFSLFIK